MVKFIEAFELPNGHTFVITDELMTRRTILGELTRDYMEKASHANSKDEKMHAIRDLFITIFDEIEAGDVNLRLEFHKTMLGKPKLACG